MFNPAAIWDEAIKRNLAKLKDVLEPLLAMLSVYEGVAAQMPRTIHRNIMRVLRPAESALRRIIVMAARDIAVAEEMAAPAPKRPPRKAAWSPPKTFQLFDPRKRHRPHRIRYSKHVPRVYVIAPDPPFIPQFLRGPAPGMEEPEAPIKRISAISITHRLHAFASALENIPREALRLAKLRQRRARKSNFKSPLRIGKPPGHQKIPTRPVDHILLECQSYASAVLADTS
jgi:hypothetical protein